LKKGSAFFHVAAEKMEHQTLFNLISETRAELEILLRIRDSGVQLPAHLQKNLEYDIQDLQRTVAYLAGISKKEQISPSISNGKSKAM
jgi:hypothetical protein